MCGIVAAITKRNSVDILLSGLQKLEYRGYDSAGLAIIDESSHELVRERAVGKVQALIDKVKSHKTLLRGQTGIAHTRWATHGKPAEVNAHPLVSHEKIALVHNGIIENFEALRQQIESLGYRCESETDTEVVAHLIYHYYQTIGDFTRAVLEVRSMLKGAFALAILCVDQPNTVIGLRSGCPLVLGLGLDEQFLSSDPLALQRVASQFIYLEEGDLAEMTCDTIKIYDKLGQVVERDKLNSEWVTEENTDKAGYRHFMLKEIFQQSQAIQNTLEGRFTEENIFPEIFGEKAPGYFKQVQNVLIVACGTSYHAALVAQYWLESIGGVSARVEIASEYRYRDVQVLPNTLFVVISQSGETADTLAALRRAQTLPYIARMGICNVAQSTLLREVDLSFLTRAGVEVGVASTKAFTTQLTALFLLTLCLGKDRGLSQEQLKLYLQQIKQLPSWAKEVVAKSTEIEELAERFVEKDHSLFLGRGILYPIALEGALKLKEISYIHAEAYPAGELKHGPLALVDQHMPIVVVAAKDHLIEKVKTNLQEVRARGGQVYLFADPIFSSLSSPGVTFLTLPEVPALFAPIVYSIPLQLLAYHVAVLKGTDVDQPRNLAKSVTVE